MSFIAFLSGALALLLAPGPTNSLIALSAASDGLRRALRLLPAELAGYLVAVVPLALAGEELASRWPHAGSALTFAAAIWVLVLALRIWRRSAMATGNVQIGPWTVFCTTVLNPKALVVGLVLLPQVASHGFSLRLVVFCAAVVTAAAVWAAGGALIRTRRGPALPPMLLQRMVAGWLGLVSLTLMTQILSA